MPLPDRAATWVVVVPLKGGARAKSRLAAGPALATAMARDCLDAVLACPQVARAVVVTDHRDTAAWAAASGAGVLAERARGAGLNAAVRDGARGVPGPCAALLGDLPALRPQTLTAALGAAGAALQADPAPMAFVPDAQGSGTVLLAARTGGALDPAFGNGSAAAHAGRGAVRLDLDLPRLRHDVDDADGLALALDLGCGPHTRRALAAGGTRGDHDDARVGAVQATVHRFDADSGAGSVLTDQGLVLPFSAETFAGSGLRHLRVGQRLSIELSGDEVASMRLGTVGVSPAVGRQ